ncbi:MAG: polysaccharide biosynthesis C-terminal domain-containing protein [Bacteroidia bacterium]|nr:polysaccharide biosynthesis C-terminal domain-containing protein [Bacteroidia bacterium]
MSSIQKQGLFNTAFAYLGVMVGFVNILILQPRFLTPEELGLTRMLFSVSIIFGTIFPLGLNGVVIRFFPQFRNRETGNYGFINLIFLTILASFMLFASGLFIFRHELFEGYSKSPLFVEYFMYIFPMTLFAGLISMMNAYAFIIFKSTVPAFLDEIFGRLYQVVILGMYFLHWIDFHTFIVLFSFMYAIQFLILFVYLRKEDRISGKIDWAYMRKQNWKEIRNFTFVIALATLASRSLRQVDVVMVGSDLSGGIPLEEVAVYTIAATIGTIVEVPSNALSKIADSKVSHALHHGDMTLVRGVYYKSARLLSAIGGLLLLGVVVNIHALLQLIGEKYTGGETVVIIMAGSAFFNMMTGLNNSIIFYSRYYITGSLLVLGMVILTLVLNYVLIPRFGITGAAIATATTFSFYNIMKYVIIWAGFGLQPLGKFVPVVLFALAAALGVNYLIPEMENKYIDMALRSVVVSAVYLPVLWFSGVVPELKKLVDILRKKAGSFELFE